jgi:hypothetical protein
MLKWFHECIRGVFMHKVTNLIDIDDISEKYSKKS